MFFAFRLNRLINLIILISFFILKLKIYKLRILTLLFITLLIGPASSAQQLSGLNFSTSEIGQNILSSSFPFTGIKSATTKDGHGPYQLSRKLDIPLAVGSGATLIAGEALVISVKPLTSAQVASLDPQQVNGFDRPATENYSKQAANISTYMAIGSALFPASLLTSRQVRHDLVPIVVMGLETGALVTGLSGLSKSLVKRTRPFVYNPEAPDDRKTTPDARFSFFSEHTSSTAALTFFTASLVSQYSHSQAVKYASWTCAILYPAAVGYFRYASGNHFPTDVISGYVIGAGTGLLIPYLHRQKAGQKTSMQLYPGLHSATLVWNLN